MQIEYTRVSITSSRTICQSSGKRVCQSQRQRQRAYKLWHPEILSVDSIHECVACYRSVPSYHLICSLVYIDLPHSHGSEKKEKRKTYNELLLPSSHFVLTTYLVHTLLLHFSRYISQSIQLQVQENNYCSWTTIFLLLALSCCSSEGEVWLPSPRVGERKGGVGSLGQQLAHAARTAKLATELVELLFDMSKPCQEGVSETDKNNVFTHFCQISL